MLRLEYSNRHKPIPWLLMFWFASPGHWKAIMWDQQLIVFHEENFSIACTILRPRNYRKGKYDFMKQSITLAYVDPDFCHYIVSLNQWVKWNHRFLVNPTGDILVCSWWHYNMDTMASDVELWWYTKALWSENNIWMINQMCIINVVKEMSLVWAILLWMLDTLAVSNGRNLFIDPTRDPLQYVNTLWPSDAICQHRSGSRSVVWWHQAITRTNVDYHLSCPVAFTWEHFHKKCSWTQSVICVYKLPFKITFRSLWVNWDLQFPTRALGSIKDYW